MIMARTKRASREDRADRVRMLVWMAAVSEAVLRRWENCVQDWEIAGALAVQLGVMLESLWVWGREGKGRGGFTGL